MDKLCECGCGEPVLRTTARFLRGHHWKVIREANGVPTFKICEHCERPYTRASVGRQRTQHWLERRYCTEDCRLAAIATDPDAPHRCARCERDLPRALFSSGSGWCTDCCRAAKRKLTPAQNRERNLKSLYGMTVEQYDEMEAAQGGLCAICGQPETVVDYRSGELHRLAVDHCHDSNKIRALLCGKCNKGLGCFGHDIDQIRLAITYLEKHMEQIS